ncbi:hypothetical protein FRB93_005840 [Tulasnella sp. JGI-2019a]|nr:hypothetical protein FRB93_005840 [Tulasnella sp. JGI-2019a]
MGGALARSIANCSPSITLLTSLAGRSEASRDRALKAGLTDVSMEDLVVKSRVIISVLPPSSAETLAQEIKAIYDALDPGQREPPIYIDANAISPSTAFRISKLLASSSIPFIDGSIIGGPPRDGYDPRLYLSAEAQYDSAVVGEVVEMLGGGGKHKNGRGLEFIVLKDAGVGAASALKASLTPKRDDFK